MRKYESLSDEDKAAAQDAHMDKGVVRSSSLEASRWPYDGPPPSRSTVWCEGRRGVELRKDGNGGEALRKIVYASYFCVNGEPLWSQIHHLG